MNKLKNIHALAYIDSRKWAIYPSKLDELRTAVLSHPHIEQALSAGEQTLAAIADSPISMYGGERISGCRYTYKRGNIAVIGVNGTLFASGGYIDDIMAFYFGGTSTQALMKDIMIAGEDPEIESIVMNINSGGGEAFGINELANIIYAIRAKKPIVAYVYGYGASAAYWIASACDKIYPDAQALLGSIGVVCAWADFSGMYEMFGIAYEEVTSSNAPYKRLDIRDAEQRAVFMSEIDGMEKVFIDSVAKFRNVKRDVVINEFGKGAVMAGHLAVKAGMADQVDSFEGVIKKLTAQQKKNGREYSAEHGEIDMSFKDKFREAMKSIGVEIGDDPTTLNISSPLNSDADVALSETEAQIVAEEKPGEVQMKDETITAEQQPAKSEPAAAATPANPPAAPATVQEPNAEETRVASAGLDTREKDLNAREEALATREAAAVQTETAAKATVRRVEFAKVAEGFAGDKDAKVTFMEAVADKFGEDSDQFKAYVEDQKALGAQVEASSLFEEKGKPGAESDIDAQTKLDTLAKERAKTDKITFEQAYQLVASENKDLAAQAME